MVEVKCTFLIPLLDNCLSKGFFAFYVIIADLGEREDLEYRLVNLRHIMIFLMRIIFGVVQENDSYISYKCEQKFNINFLISCIFRI